MADCPTETSIKRMAEEIFSFTKESWLARLASKNQDDEALSEVQFLTLDVLVAGTVPQTVGDIQRSIHVVPAQMSRIIRSLENEFDSPLIRCELNQLDKRCIDVYLTEEGRATHTDFLNDRLMRISHFLADVSAKDRSEFVRICAIMRAAAKTRSEKQAPTSN